jgi:hypothetical protein
MAGQGVHCLEQIQGSATGNWSGQMTIGTVTTLLSGTFSASIDQNGAIAGTMSGTYSGNITGNVDVNGNMTGTGNLMVVQLPT